VNRTTAKDFKLFKETAQYWIKRFGLTGWEIYIEHADDPEQENIAWCKVYTGASGLSNRTTTIGLEKVWAENDVTPLEIRKAAFHEVCELMFSRLEILAVERFVLRREIREEVHNLIRIMEHVLFK
jgi:hypothetical protein